MAESDLLHGEHGLMARTARQFPEHFRATSQANIMKATRWWKGRDGFSLAVANVSNSVQVRQDGQRKRLEMKALPGRGRKRDAWNDWLHGELIDEFHRLRKAGLKFSMSTLATVARYILEHSEHTIYSRNFIHPRKKISFYDLIDTNWVQAFQDRYNIVQRQQSGKKSVSAAKQLHIDKQVAYHMGILHRGFQTGEFNEDQM